MAVSCPKLLEIAESYPTRQLIPKARIVRRGSSAGAFYKRRSAQMAFEGGGTMNMLKKYRVRSRVFQHIL